MTNAELVQRLEAAGLHSKAQRDGGVLLTDPKRRVPNIRVHSLSAHAALSMERLLASLEQGRA